MHREEQSYEEGRLSMLSEESKSRAQKRNVQSVSMIQMVSLVTAKWGNNVKMFLLSSPAAGLPVGLII